MFAALCKRQPIASRACTGTKTGREEKDSEAVSYV
jgi:hypothetical protein